MMKLLLICFTLILLPILLRAGDSTIIKVHFLYGSKPAKKFRSSEPKWFGGMAGGHVGIELDSGRILNFVRSGKFHILSNSNNRHSRFLLSTADEFYSILGGNPDSNKSLVIHVAVTALEKRLLDSTAQLYLEATPYDYALVGMRCGAATYDLLSTTGLLQRYPAFITATLVPYPKVIRRRLVRLAQVRGWNMERRAGAVSRKWEQD